RPLARQWPWPRWVDVMTSAGFNGQHAPTAAASWPIERCTKPGTSPSRYRAATRCSNPRISTRRRCSSSSSGGLNAPIRDGWRTGSRDRSGAMERVLYWSVQTGKAQPEIRVRDDMAEQMQIPDSFPPPGGVVGKRVVITGAGRGLGTLLAHAFSDAGASVA